MAAPPLPAHAAKSICVGVVVDFRPLGGAVQTGCAKVTDGATGNQVMAAAGHSLSFRRDGLVCQVDGQPADGCSRTDSSHYWSYWHRAPGSTTWTYSSQGSGTYRPADDSTEGWVWQNGGTTGSTKPADVPYAQICPPDPPPSPAPTAPTARVTTPPPAAPVATSPSRPGGLTTAAAASRPATPGAPATTPVSTATTTVPPADTSASAVPSASASPVARARAEPPAGSGGGFPVGLVVGVVAAVALGAAAVVRARR